MNDLFSQLPKKLKERLSNELPGLDAWKPLMPFKHPLSQDFSTTGLKPAAVLVALYPHENKWMIPLILRVEDGYHHSGQVSFPGGRLEDQEELVDCALREAEEEVGILAKDVEIVGKLTPIPIHVSNFLVHPFVGILKERPNWIVNPHEVRSILEIGIEEFSEEAVESEEWDFPKRGGLCRVPFYHLRNQKIWGATAMMLNELMAILNN